MEKERPLDRRNREWGSLRDSADLRVRLSWRAKKILTALRNCKEERISYGAVIEKLAEPHANLLEQKKRNKRSQQALKKLPGMPFRIAQGEKKSVIFLESQPTANSFPSASLKPE